jgi:hypothetical protein
MFSFTPQNSSIPFLGFCYCLLYGGRFTIKKDAFDLQIKTVIEGDGDSLCGLVVRVPGC